MRTDETSPVDWFLLAAERLRAADALAGVEGAIYSRIELLQEGIERYLKGYLISQGWPLKRIHNLFALLDEAIAFDARFDLFSDLCENLTTQFWAQHYPGGDLENVGDDYEQLRPQAGELIRLIQSLVPEHFPAPPGSSSINKLPAPSFLGV